MRRQGVEEYLDTTNECETIDVIHSMYVSFNFENIFHAFQTSSSTYREQKYVGMIRQFRVQY